jgi:phage terminase large subunit GpA-like protein
MSSLIGDTLSRALQPVEETSMAEWLRLNFYTQDGRAFSEQAVPWVTAPQGPAWACDNIQFRTIWLQWAARMFKTNLGLALLMRQMDRRPGEVMFATPDEGNCKSVFGRFWKMLENCPRLTDQVPIEQRQGKTRIALARSVCHGAWPRGKSRLADKSIPVGHGNEIDKWVQEATSTEGNPLRRFLKRGAEYPDRKFVLESTPGVRGKSEVEAGRQRSTDHRYQVPCPHCFKFQELQFGDGKKAGGIFWERKDNGETDNELAKATAHYVCKWCEGKIEDRHRPAMINAGVWVPAGCEVDHEKAMRARDLPPDDRSWLTGEPIRWGSEYGSKIPVWYALFHGWGDIAYDFLSKKGRIQDLRQWTNEDAADTWEVRKSRSTPEQVGQRLRGNTPRGVVPMGGTFLTVTIDRQAADGGFIVWGVMAHEVGGEHPRAWLVDYGMALELEEIWSPIIRGQYPHEDGGNSLTPVAAAVDSGWATKETYDFCKRHPGVLPVKGASNDLQGRPYRLASLTNSRHADAGLNLLHVGTDFWETDLQHRLDDRLANEPGSLTLCREASADGELLVQLCNGTLADVTDSRGNVRLLWVKKDEHVPNDFRDVIRYGLCLAQAWLDQEAASGTVPRRTAVNTSNRKAVFYAGETRPDGRGWHD